MRNIGWHQQFITSLKSLFPELRIGVIHVSAGEVTLSERSWGRVATTGRGVPDDVLKESFDVRTINIYNHINNIAFSLSMLTL
jgi:outer membrane phospholipase A